MKTSNDRPSLTMKPKARSATPTPEAPPPPPAERQSDRTSAELVGASVTASKFGASIHLEALREDRSREPFVATLSLPWRGIAVFLDYADRLLMASDLTRDRLPQRPREKVEWSRDLDQPELFSLHVMPRFIGPYRDGSQFKVNFAPEFTPEPNVWLFVSATTFRQLAWELRWRFQQHALVTGRPPFSP
jgi:hypothetical protein